MFSTSEDSSNQNKDARTTAAVVSSTADSVLATNVSSAAHSSSAHPDTFTSQQNHASTSQNVTGRCVGGRQGSSASVNLATLGMLRLVNVPSPLKRKINDRKALHLPLSAKNSVCVNIPRPPNWQAHMQDVSQSLAPYKLFPVNSTTTEFQKLAELLHPLHINAVDQIINPKIWNRFENGRREMLKAKCSDSMLLRQLGLNDAEIAKKKQSLNFFRHKALDAAPYNDNFVLLFHCTKDPDNIELIQRDGFDERMSRGGLLGKGIYFSDNFRRSIRYDGSGGVLFVCGVLLGDCVLDPAIATAALMIEPEKMPAERRYIDDNYFDSVNGVSVSNAAHITDQYAVYNRYQCYPMYKVNYRPINMVNAIDIDSLTVVRPLFAWPAENVSHQFQSNLPWALHAKTIFDAMDGHGSIPPIWISIPVVPEEVDKKLETLKNLGYTDTELNLKALKENNYETKPTVNLLVQRNIDEALRLQSAANDQSESESEGSSYHSSSTDDDEGSSYHTSTDEDNPKPSTSKAANRSQKKAVHLRGKICLICYNNYARNSNNWRALPPCKHKLCVDCYKKIEISRTTMAGVAHTHVKCPFCLNTSGIEVGLCPNGVMTEMLIPTHCDGYEDCGTIGLVYVVNTPINSPSHPDMLSRTSLGAYLALNTRRVAFLPNNEEGQRILHLLRIAWNRRLIFTIGTSHTTGRENALVWNIHHKTSQKGGVSCHGFPDATYLDRVRAELKSFGIE